MPPDSTLLFSLDGSNPANNGTPYAHPGIEASQGGTVRLHAEKGGVIRTANIIVPKTQTGDDDGIGNGPNLKPDLPATVNGKALALVTRSATYDLLNSLPADARLQRVQVKSSVAASDTTVTMTWDSKTQLMPRKVLEAFEFLDKQVTGGEWSLRFEYLHFVTGQSLLQWQVDAGFKIEWSWVTQ